ncbi:hypothetical protein A0H81_09087 [Grifola frondosa]|uniref:Uncharacterized protein n=1 Tax=Grifola frondosa TaxID=5627 RepID=A0A1C7M2W8_GRIFR|nr:hypothetical protein A0H81_09087 [Grifola frondosa]
MARVCHKRPTLDVLLHADHWLHDFLLLLPPAAMEHESGDSYVRRIAGYIRTHERGLAAAAISRKRRTKAVTDTSVFNPMAWFAADNTDPLNAKPVILSFDQHHLFYLLMRFEALGFPVGSLDTTVSRLSLGASWWGSPSPPSVDAELKYIYSSFTKLPALTLHAPEAKLIAELANDAPNENALPLDAFKNLQSLQCVDIDPRTLLGWDRLAESLKSLTVKRSGLEDVSDIFISAVADDQARREGRSGSGRTRWSSHGPQRQSSFHSTQLPESVPEDAEDAEADSIAQETPRPSTPALSLKWAFLRHLSLSDNALTFLPTSPLLSLTSLTHLDLSSNLLVSVPSGLSALYSLVSLNLSDNMIDSVLGIYTMLGQVLYLNLSRNRLESICGLERLLALERVDLRHNLIEESAEIGRLATLPNIAEVWVEGNPLVEMEEGYRIRCFDFFWKEKKDILLDGSPPGFYEKRYLTSPPPEQMSSSRPPSVAYSPPVVAVASSSTVGGMSPAHSAVHSPATSSPPSHAASPQLGPAHGRGRRKKAKRIVDLDGATGGSEGGSPRSGSRLAETGRRSAAATKTVSPAKPTAPSTEPLPEPSTSRDAEPAATSSPSTPVVRPKSKHSRHMTECMPSVDLSHDGTATETSSLRKSATLSRATARRARVSASVYEPTGGEASQFKEADAFRARIEALRSDMGDGWLKVFNQSHLGSPGVPSG